MKLRIMPAVMALLTAIPALLVSFAASTTPPASAINSYIVAAEAALQGQGLEQQRKDVDLHVARLRRYMEVGSATQALAESTPGRNELVKIAVDAWKQVNIECDIILRTLEPVVDESMKVELTRLQKLARGEVDARIESLQKLVHD